jgi:hypothetical protein
VDRGATRYVIEFVAGQAALLDQIHHRQQQLPAFGEKFGQLPFAGLSLFVDRVPMGGRPTKRYENGLDQRL